ncbi:NAD kinase [Nocardioides sp.]|uniref:NAD kinase n=1 Tax=Nocardioides sp. TaxID=35761 RepID=UPI0035281E10
MTLEPDVDGRRVLLVAHLGKPEVRDLAGVFVAALTAQGLRVRLPREDAVDVSQETSGHVEVTDSLDDAGRDCELAIVLGGDGTILRAAELTRESATPLLGVNLGHVGFLAEAEPEHAEAVIDAVVDRRYVAEDRLTLDVTVTHRRELLLRTFALNEASVEKGARQRMLEVVVGIDGRPLSRWGCDGVVFATPTGSTAYNFSAGGPVVWPNVEALLMVPLSAHALFARPMVVNPDSSMAVELLESGHPSPYPGVLWCDGRRMVDLPAGAQVEVRRAAQPVRLIRLHQRPFTDRLVAKFGLRVEGWRGAAERRRQGGVDA